MTGAGDGPTPRQTARPDAAPAAAPAATEAGPPVPPPRPGATPPHAVIAAGGTGGHMFPAQALAETLLGAGWRVTLATDARGARYAGGFPPAVARRVLSAASPAQSRGLARLAVPFRVAAGIVSALLWLRRDRPAVVVGFGGYPALPAMAAAILLRLPRLIHEQNGVPGSVNARLARHVDAVACGTWPTRFPDRLSGRTEVRHVGNPVRAAVRARAAAPYIPPGDYPMNLLVVGGSQGARALSDHVPAAVAALPGPLRDRLRVAHQARAEDMDRVVAAYGAAGVDATVQPFFDDIPARLAEAQVVICRAGASTIADLTTIGRPAILIPYPHAAGDHQTANARALVDAGGAILMPESLCTPETLASALGGLLTDATGAQQMAAHALAAGRRQAAEELAAMVAGLAGASATEGGAA